MSRRFMFDIKQLRYFVKVAEFGSFTKASEELYVAQSALSHQIQQLETCLGVILFNRDRRGLTLTDAGQITLRRAQNIFDEIATLQSEVSALAIAPTGTVSLGVLPSVARMLVPPVVEQFHQQFPLVRLQIEEETAATMYSRLIDGRIDLAVLYDVESDTEVQATTLIKERMHLIGTGPVLPSSVEGSITLEELQDIPLVLPTASSGWRRIIEKAFAARGVRPTIRAEIDSLSSIKELVLRGLGYTIIPRYFARTDPLSDRMWELRIGPPPIAISIALARFKRRQLSHAGVALERLVLRVARELNACHDETSTPSKETK